MVGTDWSWAVFLEGLLCSIKQLLLRLLYIATFLYKDSRVSDFVWLLIHRLAFSKSIGACKMCKMSYRRPHPEDHLQVPTQKAERLGCSFIGHRPLLRVDQEGSPD